MKSFHTRPRQFKEKYPKIELEVIHNSGDPVPPKEIPKDSNKNLKKGW